MEKVPSLETFCCVSVPDFTPLGGNRPDCAIVLAAAVSLMVEDLQKPLSVPSLLLLPPDVLDTAMAATCAPVIIRSPSEVVPPPHGCDRGDRLSCRLEIGLDADLEKFRNCPVDYSYEEKMPWINFKTVCLQMTLPGFITWCPRNFLNQCRSLATVDLRKTKLKYLGDFFLYGCVGLKEVYLPDTLRSVGDDFLSYRKYVVSIDLRNTKLQQVGNNCFYCCTSLTGVYLPDTLSTTGDRFLQYCSSLVSIDLRNTKIETVDSACFGNCEKLTSIQLPDSLQAVGYSFLSKCSSLASIDLRNTKLRTAGDDFLHSCASLSAVHIPDTLSSAGRAFLGNSKSTRNCLSKEEVANLKRIIKERGSNKRNRD